ncbi:MAG: 16S rRNA (guanine(966)-N(2))-methyltransferase RsmD [Defluviitaleaceae bacterium]|nr:16S rRNA (guanine(966)-N(2))-methyltransferase RsmD [Defluviitaleaceae bacterium]
MRVIAGSARGTVLFSPRGDATRPTSDFVKENIFNIIRDDVYGVDFLDLFAGSGAVGIEALSRGANSATFVDASQKCVALVQRNLEKTRLKDKAVVIKADATNAIEKLAAQGQKFGIIFLDPPYFGDFVDNVLQAIVHKDILARDGYIILEMSKHEAVPRLGGLTVFKEKEYSGTRLVFMDIPGIVRDDE